MGWSSRECSRFGAWGATGGSSTSVQRGWLVLAAAARLRSVIRFGCGSTESMPLGVGWISCPPPVRTWTEIGRGKWAELDMAKGRKRKAAPGDVATNRQATYRYN